MKGKFCYKIKPYLLHIAYCVLLSFFIFIPFALANNAGDDSEKSVFERLSNVAKEAGLSKPGQYAEAALPIYLGSIIRIALTLLGVIFFALVVYGGFLWLYAGGNDEQVKKAKTIIVRSLIGFLIVIFAGAIVQFVMTYATR